MKWSPSLPNLSRFADIKQAAHSSCGGRPLSGSPEQTNSPDRVGLKLGWARAGYNLLAVVAITIRRSQVELQCLPIGSSRPNGTSDATFPIAQNLFPSERRKHQADDATGNGLRLV